MGFKDLFIISEETPNDKPKEVAKQSAQTTKFPTATSEVPTTSFPTDKTVVDTPTFTPTFTPQTSASTEHLEKMLDNYQKGFESLNQPGFDFYEFYQSVSSSGIDNPQVYIMAFQMASAMDKSISKEKLIQQADFYLTELNRVCQENITKGNSKKSEIESYKANENQSLINELGLLKQQEEAIKAQIEDRTRKLEAIGSKYDPQISEIEGKLAANTIAKDRITNSISQVKQGIQINIK